MLNGVIEVYEHVCVIVHVEETDEKSRIARDLCINLAESVKLGKL